MFNLYIVPLLLRSLNLKSRLHILCFWYSLFCYGDQVCFLLGWGVMNRLACVTFIWSHKKMSGNPCHLFCRKLVLPERDMLHQTMLEIPLQIITTPAKQKQQTLQNLCRTSAEQISWIRSVVLTVHIYVLLISFWERFKLTWNE